MCDEFLMGCMLLTAFIHLCVLFSGILIHLLATLTGYVRHTAESYCVSWIYCPMLAVWQVWGK